MDNYPAGFTGFPEDPADQGKSQNPQPAKSEVLRFINWLNTSRMFYVDEVREWLRQYDNEEISLSKFVEFFNQKVLKSDQLVVRLRELVKVQDNYIEFLDKESSPFVHFASLHGMTVKDEVARNGEAYRFAIKSLKDLATLSANPYHQTLGEIFSDCDAAGHYGEEPLPEGICPKCGKPWRLGKKDRVKVISELSDEDALFMARLWHSDYDWKIKENGGLLAIVECKDYRLSIWKSGIDFVDGEELYRGKQNIEAHGCESEPASLYWSVIDMVDYLRSKGYHLPNKFQHNDETI